MRNTQKKWNWLLILTLFIAVTCIFREQVYAKDSVEVPDSIRIGVNTLHEGSAFNVTYGKNEYHVTNLKTNSKNAKSKVKYTEKNGSSNSSGIEVCAYKQGAYTISFDLCDKKGKKVSSHTVKVYAYSDSPIRSASFDGTVIIPDDWATEQSNGIVTKTSKGIFSVKMNQGYKLKKITAFMRDKDGNSIERTVKNNAVVALGTTPDRDEWGSYKGEYRKEENMFAFTTFVVYYYDKYSKKENHLNYTVNLDRLSSKVAETTGKEKRSPKIQVPKAVHIQSRVSNLYIDTSSFDISYGKNYFHVKNLRTNSVDLKAKLVQTVNEKKYGDVCNSTIGLFAEKDGDYVTMFDVCDSAGKVVGSYEVKVYAYPIDPIKTVKFAGNQLTQSVSTTFTEQSKGKLSVVMNKGYQLKNIQVTTYDRKGKEIHKTVQNSSTINTGKYPYRLVSEMGKEYVSTIEMMYPETQIDVQYVDPYTKEVVKNKVLYVIRLRK